MKATTQTSSETPNHPSSKRVQRGYILLTLMLAMALVLIALTAVLPALTEELRREKEEELIHRGVQYTRAIRRYYRSFGTYPISLEQLEGTNQIHFLRKRYTDPITGRDFRTLHPYEVHLLPKNSGTNALNAGQSYPSSASPSSSSAMGAADPVFGGGPIVGVVSTSEQESFRVFNNDDHYNGWLFVYSPSLETRGLFTRPFDGLPTFPGVIAPVPSGPEPILGPTVAPGVQLPNPK
jgi:type II secretory pathway pseudopilin PulG